MSLGVLCGGYSILDHPLDLQAAAHSSAIARTTPLTATYVPFTFSAHISQLTLPPTQLSRTHHTASHPRRHRCPRRVPRRLGGRATVHRAQGHAGRLRGRVFRSLHARSLFNDPPRKIGLTGVFLFASTTARSSNALLGWNCGYVFHSNVSVCPSWSHRPSSRFPALLG